MKSVRPHRTLNLKWPFGQVALQTALILSVICVAAELLARSPLVEAMQPVPTIDGSWELGLKLMVLDRLAASQQSPDCIIVGSSQSYSGIDPDIVAQVYQDQLNQPFRCFNFGLSQLNIQGAGRIAEIVIQKYHPRLLIIGANFRDFNNGTSLDTPFTDYYLGAPSLEGWLEAQSIGFRYVNTYLSFPIGEWPTGEMADGKVQHVFASNGFLPRAEAIDIGSADFATNKGIIHYSRLSSRYAIDRSWTEWVERVARHDSADVRVVFVELPLPDAVYAALPKGERTHQIFVDALSQTTSSAGGAFLQTQDVVRIPDDGWYNLFHLNARGAAVLSRWIGQQVVIWLADHPLRSPRS